MASQDDVSRPVQPGASEQEFNNRAPDIAAAVLLKKLGYNVDAGGPLYYLSLAKFLQGASDAEKKLAETPEGLLLVLHRRVDTKLNEAVQKEGVSPLGWVGIGIAAVALVYLLKESDD